MTKYLLSICIVILFGIFFTSCKEDQMLFVGGFAKPGEKALSLFEFNKRNGDLELISEADGGLNPSYFYYSGERGLLYVLNEVMQFNGTFSGGLTTLKYDVRSGLFEKLNEILIPYAK
ncbi:MAG TPA: beta-propeller fold lactonase family protein [Bacteroidales bacterium]|nr:beta-propeller fold lactonase family protein [Bacteroidales bacterium]